MRKFFEPSLSYAIAGGFLFFWHNFLLAIYFQVFAYEYPQMNADKRRCLSAADSSAFIRVHPRFVKAVFPGKNPGKLLAGYLALYEKV